MGKNADIFAKIAEILSVTGKHPTLREGAEISVLLGITNRDEKTYNPDYPEGFSRAWAESVRDFDYSQNVKDKETAKLMKETFVGENGEYAWKKKE